MIGEGVRILKQFSRKWQLYRLVQTVLYAISAALLVYFLADSYAFAIAAFIIVLTIAALIIKPLQPNAEKACDYLNQEFAHLEYSTSLLLQPTDHLKGLEKLQQHKINATLKAQISKVNPPHQLIQTSLISLTLVVLGYFGSKVISSNTPNAITPSSEEIISFQPVDSVAKEIEIPSISIQKAIITYPSYTNLGSSTSTSMNIKALEGSKVTWNLKFSAPVNSVFMESAGKSYPMRYANDQYSRSDPLKDSGIYSFKFNDLQGNSYTSELYTIEVFEDQSPEVSINNLDQFSSFEYFDTKTIRFDSKITDDFGLEDAYIIATVSKGSGESVKFREEKLRFNSAIASGSKQLNLSKSLNLDSLKMTPGDELYFYVEALDRKRPTPNKTRSETYFAVIKDTTNYEFSLENTLGVDRMPDYFRSQRQLIIDTEKLISQRGKLPTKDFKFTSNELGYDQKVLRLKYAEFMGEETESGIVIEEDIEALESEEDHDHDHEHEEEEDPLAEYTHAHDHDNEHNLVDESKKDEGKELLEAYQHDHGDPESATLYEESLKTKLRKALNEMWDSELYLRLYEPEKSLPYQYRALRLIQDIKNHARIYVHRIGFDPPPIKEEKRLSGDLDEIANFTKKETIEITNSYPFTEEAIQRLLVLINTQSAITDEDRSLFEATGNELAQIAIDNPGNHLQTLQKLKQLTVFGDHPNELLTSTLQGLFNALPTKQANPSSKSTKLNTLDQLYLKELAND